MIVGPAETGVHWNGLLEASARVVTGERKYANLAMWPSTPRRPGGISSSPTQADRGWAEWIAWVLEEAGYRVLVQAWDMVPGSNWANRMNDAVRHSARTVAVVSPNYQESVYGTAEWQHMFGRGRLIDYGGTIATLWSLTLDQLRSSHPAAVQLAAICAYLAAENLKGP